MNTIQGWAVPPRTVTVDAVVPAPPLRRDNTTVRVNCVPSTFQPSLSEVLVLGGHPVLGSLLGWSGLQGHSSRMSCMTVSVLRQTSSAVAGEKEALFNHVPDYAVMVAATVKVRALHAYRATFY